MPDPIETNPPKPVDVRAEARRHLEAGRQVVPIPPRKKGPVLTNWPSLRLDPSEVAKRFSAKSNLGLILGDPSGGLVDVDLDCQEARELAAQYLPPTPTHTGRASAPKSHWWYVAPGAMTVQHNDPVTRKRVVELRSTGCQTVVGPSIHPSGEAYDLFTGEPAEVDAGQLAEAVAQLNAAVLEARGHLMPTATPQVKRLASKPATDGERAIAARAIAYLNGMPPAIEGQNGSGVTYAAARHLVTGFGLSAERSLDLLLAHYNPRCVPPWTEKELRHKVDSAIRNPSIHPDGYLRDAECPGLGFEATADRGVDLDGLLGERATGVDAFPSHLLEVPGLIGLAIEHNLATAHRPQPILALAAAVALQATLAGRKVRDARGNRTNVYLVALARSGAGKDHGRKLNRRILHHAGLGHLEGPEDIASDAGLISAVTAEPCSLFQLDEFGRFMATLREASKSPHLWNIVSTLLRLYSSADTVFQGKAYSDRARNAAIDQPCVVLHATTVPESFWSNLTADSLANGFLARLIVLESDTLPPEQVAEERPLPESLVEAAQWWGAYRPHPGNLATQFPEPLVVRSDGSARAVFGVLTSHIDQLRADPKNLRYDAILARVVENACRLALIYACSAKPEAPLIDSAAAGWGCFLAEHLAMRLTRMAEERIAESLFDAQQSKVLEVIRQAGDQINRRDLVRRVRHMPRRTLDDVIANLAEGRWIATETIKTKGRSVSLYRAIR